MVQLHIKRGDDSQFLYECPLTTPITELSQHTAIIFNGRLKIHRICYEIEELIKHGPMYPPEILGLTPEQVEELKLVDIWEDKVFPSGGWDYNKDPIGRRNGRQPKPNMQEVLKNAVNDARNMITKKLVDSGKPLVLKDVHNALDILRGSVMCVYPMQLAPHDVIRMEFTNTEDLAGTQASLEIIEPVKAELWFAGHQMLGDKLLLDYLGQNEKCKVIVKLGKMGEGAPGREPVLSEEARKQLMLQQYRRQEELKHMDDDDDDQYLNSSWADSTTMKSQVHGVQNVKFRYGF